MQALILTCNQSLDNGLFTVPYTALYLLFDQEIAGCYVRVFCKFLKKPLSIGQRLIHHQHNLEHFVIRTEKFEELFILLFVCLLYTSPSPRD